MREIGQSFGSIAVLDMLEVPQKPPGSLLYIAPRALDAVFSPPCGTARHQLTTAQTETSLYLAGVAANYGGIPHLHPRGVHGGHPLGSDTAASD